MTNVVLAGFMGVGKTTVGREAARRMGRSFVDMDALIETQTGKSIPSIFDEDGEDVFRRMEAALCQELSAQEGLVIAAGGGALIDPTSRAEMLTNGAVICLTCDVEEILRRVKAESSTRPLLNVADPRARIEQLLATRRESYAAIPWQIDTTKLSIEDAAERVAKITNAITLPVRHPGGEYPIHIGLGLLNHIGGALRATGVPYGAAVALVSNPVVAPLYGQQVKEALQAAGFPTFTCSIPDGEQHKTLSTVAALYDQFLAGGLERDGVVLSLGGGVTGDVAGFAAATYMRGVRFAQIPTTLLAMVDASVGGKTGVDLSQGKNLAGAFKQPELVFIDPTVLTTLPAEEIRSGMAEVIKHAIIGAPDLLTTLRPPHDSPIPISTTQLARALRVKIEIVEDDPFEQGRRAVLNLGHTVGHALERLSNFEMRHGEAVGIGMVAAARIASELGRAAPSLPERIVKLLTAWGLPSCCPDFDVDAIWRATRHDKKRRSGKLRWALPNGIGEMEIVEDIPPRIIKSTLCDMGARRQE